MIRLNNGVTKQFLLGAAVFLCIVFWSAPVSPASRESRTGDVATRSARDTDSEDRQKLVSLEKTAAKGGEQWITGYSS